MKTAIIGSRTITSLDLSQYLPTDITEIVSGGAKGIDTIAKEYAQIHHIKLTEFLPDYAKYGRAAPLKRNDAIIAYSDYVLAFWDGKSKGTQYVIKQCNILGIEVEIIGIP